MNQNDIRNSVEEILENSNVGTMATIKNNKPYSRYMKFHHNDLKLLTATSKETDKVEDVKENPYTHILLGYGGEGFGDDYVEYTGKVSINDSNTLKAELWDEYMEEIFDGPDDPNYVVLEIDPHHIQLMNKDGITSHVLEI